MDSSRLLILFTVSILLGLLAPAVAQVNDAVCTYTADFCRRCSYIGTYEDGGAYQKNLNTLLSSLSSNNQTNSGFYNSSTGQDPYKVNAIALCRGDVSLNDCHTCVNQSSSILFTDCLNQDEAIIWGERCMVRYSSKSIFGTQEDEPIKYVPSLSNATDPEEFDLVLNLFLDTLTGKAASGDSLKKFAAGHCTPDLGKKSCSDCLKGAISKIPECCGGKQGGRVLKPSCNLRFETNLFYNFTADSLVTLPGKKSSISKAVIIITAVAIVFVAMILIGIFISLRMRRRRKKLKLKSNGYMAPEYAIHGSFSVKSDVFSFGVLVLEILSGRKITSFQSAENEEDLLTYAWRKWKEDTVSNIIDPVLMTGLGTETMRCIHIGLLCVQENVASRPTMTSVVSMLNSHSMTLPLPSRPAYYLHNSETDTTERTQSYESKKSEHVSINEDSITELPLLLFILPAIFDLLAPTMAQFDLRTCTSAAEYCWICSDTAGNYTPGDIYQSNLKRLFSSFSSDTRNKSGFYNSSMGQDSNKVNAIALCRGDLALGNCSTCVNESTHLLLQNCPNHKEAILWGERCMVRYSYNLIFGIEQGDPTKYLPSPNSAKNSQQFEAVLNPLLGILIGKAASGDSLKKFAAGHANIPDAETIHAFAQCTPDINQQNCSNCLKDSFSIIPGCCGGKSGGRVLKPSCSLRYENNGDFFGPFTTSQIDIPVPPALAPAPAAKKSNTREIVIIITVVSVAVAIIMSSICIFLRMMKRRVKLREGHGNSDENLVESLQYDFETIKSATDDFSDANKLGRGGFGTVYKGRLLNGQLIAVKRLSKNSEQGDREFKNEVELLAQLQHRNLVRLLGFCIKAKERLLIYQYVANASLDHFIFDPQNNAHLEWETRYKIIQGIARGILYLHEDSRVRIIHRDLKASNILLDEDMNPKIADFGMARLFMIDQTQGDTKTIVGTYGYMAPEYAVHGRFSVKTDIFSFGVLVLEIISAKKIGSFQYGKNAEDLLSYAWRNWREETPQNIIDPTLTTSSRIEIMRCIHIGLLCVQQNAVDRPTVVSIVSMLNSETLTLSVPSRPAFFLQDDGELDLCLTTLTESDESKSSSIYVTQNEPSNITEPYPR
ncbi:unnamed protein product [Malus baccata var. baccata]